MRLNQKYIKTIKESFINVFKSGDIDLYLIVDDKTNLFRKKIKFLSKIKMLLGEQKIDIVFNKDSDRLIEKEAIKWGIKL